MRDGIGGDADGVRDDAPWCAGDRVGWQVFGGHGEALGGRACIRRLALDLSGVHGRFSGGWWRASERDRGGIDCGGEPTGVGRVIAEVERCGVLEQVVSEGAGGHGAPEFGGEQEREYSARACEFEAALCERDRDVGLDAECRVACGVPGDFCEPCAEVFACRCIEVVGPDPRWVADDEIESAGRCRIAEVRSEVEIDCAAVVELASLLLQLSDDRADECESSALGGGEAEPRIEEGVAACESEEFSAFVLQCRDASVGEEQRIAAFGGVDAQCANALSRAGRARVVDAECGDACRAWESCIIEGIVAECVAGADVVIEVGEGGDVGGAGGIVVDDDGEPESQFAEPDGHWCDIDAEDRVGEDVSADRCDGAWVAELLAECGETLEGGDKDAAGAAGGVEDADRVEC